MKVIAVIQQPAEIDRILRHLVKQGRRFGKPDISWDNRAENLIFKISAYFLHHLICQSHRIRRSISSNNGGTATVTRPTDADTEVILTATLTDEDGNTETKTITVMVKKLYGGVVTTLAGTGASGSADGTGTSASFNYPYGVCTDGTDLYVGDSTNHLIRKGELSD